VTPVGWVAALRSTLVPSSDPPATDPVADPPAGNPAGGPGRRVIGRSRDAETRKVVVGDGPPRRAGTPPPAAPPSAPPAAAPPVRRPVTVIGRSSGSSRSSAPSGSGAVPPPPPVAPPGRRGAPGGRGPGARRPFPLRRVVVAVVLLALLLPVALFAFGWWQFSRIPRVDVASALSSSAGAGTNYLIVGTDSREGIAEDDPNAGAFLDEGVAGSRTDTMMVLRMEGGGARLLSIPRDLWVQNPATGEMGRINSTFAQGPVNLVSAVTALGIPVDHYMEINFVSFARLVDAVGGITIDFPAPARDGNSGLQVDQAGPVTLDGSQALAYVRSRYYEQLVDGEWQSDPTADIGRTERQRTFLTAMMSAVGGERNPISLARVPGALGAGMKIDDRLSYLDALGLAWDFRGVSPEAVVLPVTPRTTSGGAAVLELQQPAASEVLAGFAS
jgi:LCP family protein required for cell wall assembly